MKLINLRKKLGEIFFGDVLERRIQAICTFVEPNEKILDLGTGQGLLARKLKDRGFEVTTADVVNKSYYPDIQPVIYDGEHLPFPDKSFDVCLLIAILHHANNEKAVLKEVARVAKKLVVLEDTYKSRLQKYYVKYMDSIINKEFFGHPHHNKTDAQWRKLFEEYGLKLINVIFTRTWGWIDNPIYFLTSPKPINS